MSDVFFLWSKLIFHRNQHVITQDESKASHVLLNKRQWKQNELESVEQKKYVYSRTKRSHKYPKQNQVKRDFIVSKKIRVPIDVVFLLEKSNENMHWVKKIVFVRSGTLFEREKAMIKVLLILLYLGKKRPVSYQQTYHRRLMKKKPAWLHWTFILHANWQGQFYKRFVHQSVSVMAHKHHHQDQQEMMIICYCILNTITRRMRILDKEQYINGRNFNKFIVQK